MKHIHSVTVRFFSFLLAMLFLLPLSGCGEPTEEPSSSAEKSSAATSGESSGAASGTSVSEKVSEEPDIPLPEEGELKLLADGKEPIPAEFDRKNGCYRDGKVAFFVAGAKNEKGLLIDAETTLTVTVKDQKGSVVQEGEQALDFTAFPELQGENGALGVCVTLSEELPALKKFDKYRISVSFTDKNGKQFTLTDAEFYYGLQYFGILSGVFDFSGEGIATKMGKSMITLTKTIDGTDFTFVLNLAKWDKLTSVPQIVTCAKLFWYCYPKMYARFGKDVGSPTKVTLAFENEGYEIASTGGDFVHIHDRWLKDHRTDYDCLTHEFAHVIQNGWDGNFCEYSDYIERFADYCRYIYAYNEGLYNDTGWTMQTVSGEGDLKSSVRFLAWLDYNYSTPENDIVKRWFNTCYSKKFIASRWDDAWASILEGTPVAGKTGLELFKQYKADEFAKLTTAVKKRGGVSPLNEKYDVRNKLLNRLF